MSVGLVRTAWAGTSGGPGVTQLAITEGNGAFWTEVQAQNAVNHVRTFWDSIKANLPSAIALTVSPVVDLYNEVDGELVASEQAPTAPTTVLGTSSATFSMASGMKMQLNTLTIRNGRRVRGSVFIVPGAQTIYATNGSVASAVRATVNTAGNTLVSNLAASGLTLVVWSRPRTVPTTRVGAISTVTGIEVSEKVAVLRGRRD